MKCSRCGQDSVIRQGNQMLCGKHYRFGQMRQSARRNGKITPSHEDLEAMVPIGFICGDCGVQMNWRSKDGRSTVASLQHYRDGSLAIVCLSCNARHASMDGDSYRDMPKDHKRCPSCSVIKCHSAFSVDSGRTGKLKRKSICKDCSDKKVSQWKERNRDEYNKYQRDYRAMRKSQGNPVSSGS